MVKCDDCGNFRPGKICIFTSCGEDNGWKDFEPNGEDYSIDKLHDAEDMKREQNAG
jgi:hypothetical protein